jgi:glutamate-1-semialdehyde 2,1-aminomutase
LVHPLTSTISSVEYICQKYAVAALITEPILQNIGIVKPKRDASRAWKAGRSFDSLIFDEVKPISTRLAGYAGIAESARLAVWKPSPWVSIAVLGGRKEGWIVDSSRSSKGAHRRDL